MSFYTFMPTLLNMSLTASVAIVLVTLLRLLLKKAPKVISYALWGVVLFRLLCPVSIGSDFSVYNLFDTPTEESGTATSIIEYVPSNIVHTEYPAVALPVPGISDAINETLPQGEEQLRANPLEGPIFVATYVWMAGVLAMVIYSIVSYIRLRRKLSVVIPLRDNIFIADDIKSPFVVGLFRPKIYLPCNLGDKEQEYIILHEQHHIKRLDHVMKALAFLALAIHWFNPLVWVAFVLASKDMEMSCDEAVIRKVGGDVRADYSASLLTLATGRHIIAGTPLAFGEGDTKGRINNLSKWKKPAVWVVLLAVLACAILAIGLLTNPAAEREFPINGSNVSELDTEMVVEKIAKAEGLENSSQLLVDADNFDLMFTSNFNWANDGAIRFLYGRNQKYYSAQLRMFHDDNKYFITDRSEWIEPEKVFLLSHYLDALKYILNYNFCLIGLTPLEEGGELSNVSFQNSLSCTNKIGDYPIITSDAAREMLLNGEYITTVPSEYLHDTGISEEMIAKEELVYRTENANEIFMPYYRYYIELKESGLEVADGLKLYGVYYVPAVSAEYLVDFPIWDGSFN